MSKAVQLGGAQAGGAVVADGHRVALVLEVPADVLRDVPIVFHQQDSHHRTRPWTGSRRQPEGSLKGRGRHASSGRPIVAQAGTGGEAFQAASGGARSSSHDHDSPLIRVAGRRADRGALRTPAPVPDSLLVAGAVVRDSSCRQAAAQPGGGGPAASPGASPPAVPMARRLRSSPRRSPTTR